MRGEDLALLAGNVLGAAVLVTHGVPHAHVDSLAVALVAAHNGRHHDQGVLGDKVANAPVLAGVVSWLGHQVELEGLDGAEEQHDAADVAQQGLRESHGDRRGEWVGVCLCACVILGEIVVVVVVVVVIVSSIREPRSDGGRGAQGRIVRRPFVARALPFLA